MSERTAHSIPETTASPRILFACGGTGGHVYPAIAIADAIRTREPRAVIAFAGTRDRMEWQAVPKAGYEIHAVTVSGFQRGLSREALTRNVSFPFKLVRGLMESLRLVRSTNADVVVGTGGYVAGPVGVAASLRRRPLVLQEQNAYAGATNKLLSRFAERIFLAFDAALDFFPRNKSVVAGNPVRADLSTADPHEARAHFGVDVGQHVLLVMGGSLGAGPINEALSSNIERMLEDERLVVVWQTGSRYFDELERTIPKHPRLRLMPFLDRMDLAYAVADLAVCRAGAITCSELAVTGTPSILVPSPNVTADHQTKNARAMSDGGAAVLMPEGEVGNRLLDETRRLLADDPERERMAAAARAMARPDAADEIADYVLNLARGGKPR